MDKIRIDSHKLIYHISRVNQWLKGENTYPIYAEIALYGGCNQRCIFCTFDYLSYKPVSLKKECLRRFIVESRRNGLKAVLYAGEGEPLLHSQADEIMIFTKEKGVDVALSTNGVYLNKERAIRILPYLSWVRLSINAGTKEKYNYIHGVSTDDFKKVLRNLKDIVKIRNQNNYSCTIEVQSVLLPQNYSNMLNLAAIASKIGVDYFIIKPFSKHPFSKKVFDYSAMGEESLLLLKKQLANYQKDNFQVIYRQRSIDKMQEPKPYTKCLGFSFATRITAEGDVFPCNAFAGKKEYSLGNMCKDSFDNIWKSKRRKEIIEKIYSQWDVEKCRKPCRLDEINRYLWELKNPSPHVNFI